MNIVLLDADTIGRDIDLSIFNKLGNVRIYGFSTDDEMRDRVADADVKIGRASCRARVSVPV